MKQYNIRSIIYSQENFPPDGYSFCDGQLSVYFNEGAELCFLSYIGYPINTLAYPIQYYPLVTRNLQDTGRGRADEGKRVFSPFLRFQSRRTKGKHALFWPGKSYINPLGFQSEHLTEKEISQMKFTLDNSSLTFLLTDCNRYRSTMRVYLETSALNVGQIHSKETGYHVSMLLRNLNIKYRENDGIIWVLWDAEYRGLKQKIFMTIASKWEFKVLKAGTTWLLDFNWKDISSNTFPLFLCIGTNEQEVKERLQLLRRDSFSVFRKQERRLRKIADEIPELKGTKITWLGNLFRACPMVLDTFNAGYRKLGAVQLRASQLKYGVFGYGWDQPLTLRCLIGAGQWKTAKEALRNCPDFLDAYYDDLDKKRIIDHSRNYPGFTWFWANSALMYYDHSYDERYLKEVYPSLKKYIVRHLDEVDRRGFIPCTTSGVDFTEQLGETGESVPAMEMQVWYEFLRRMECVSARRGDTELSMRVSLTAQQFAKAFLPLFLDSEWGHPVNSISGDTKRQLKCHPCYALFAYSGHYGDNLFWQVSERIADFIEVETDHPNGRFQMPLWDNIYEMWHSVKMMHYESAINKILRLTHRTDELLKTLDFFYKHFQRNGTVLEAHNLLSLGEDYLQNADWIDFATWAWYFTILESFIGIEIDYGGLTYLPCDFPLNFTVTNLKLGKSLWKIKVTGRGNFCKGIRIDGKFYPNICKIPFHLRLNGKHTLEIEREKEPPVGPCLLSAPGCGIEYIRKVKKELQLILRGSGRVPVKFYSHKTPEVIIDGKTVDLHWDSKSRIARCEVIFQDKNKLILKGVKL